MNQLTTKNQQVNALIQAIQQGQSIDQLVRQTQHEERVIHRPHETVYESIKTTIEVIQWTR